MFKIYKEAASEGFECIYDDTQSDLKVIREPKLTMEESAAGTLEFIVASGFSEFSKPLEYRDIVYVSRINGGSENIIWAGQVSTSDVDSYLDETVECYGLLDCLNDIPQPETAALSTKYEDAFAFLDAIIDYYNSFLPLQSSRRIIVSNITRNAAYSIIKKKTSGIYGLLWLTFYKMGIFPRTLDSTLENIRQSFLDKLGGQIILRHELSNDSSYLINYLDYIDAYDTENRQTINQTIEFGKNIIEIDKRASAEDFATAIIPYGPILTDVDKSWTYYKTKGKTQVDVYGKNPSAIDFINTVNLNTGKFIDSKDGSVIIINSDSNYVVFPDIEVFQDERYYLSGCLKSILNQIDGEKKTPIAFAILDEDGKLLSSGGSVTNKTENNVETASIEEFKDLQITIPEKGKTLRIGMYFDNNTRVGILKRYNQFYAEQRLSIMSYDHTLVSQPYHKESSYPKELDVYPDYVNSIEWTNSFAKSRILYHDDLVADFGIIIAVKEYDDLMGMDGAPVDEMDLYRRATDELDEMVRKVELEIQAADLSYIDHSLDSFGLLDLVHIKSDPHAVDVVLPITKIELPLEKPEEAIYTLVNTIKEKGSTPLYMSQYTADNYGTSITGYTRDDFESTLKNIFKNVSSNLFSNLDLEGEGD